MILYLAAQPSDMNVNGSVTAEVIEAPHLIENGVPVEHPARAAHQELKQFVFLVGKRNEPVIYPHLAAVEVYQ